MAHFKRKRSRKQTVGCQCCHILKNNSAERTKPKDRQTAEEIREMRRANKITNYPRTKISTKEAIDDFGFSVDRVRQSRLELENGEYIDLSSL